MENAHSIMLNGKRRCTAIFYIIPIEIYEWSEYRKQQIFDLYFFQVICMQNAQGNMKYLKLAACFSLDGELKWIQKIFFCLSLFFIFSTMNKFFITSFFLKAIEVFKNCMIDILLIVPFSSTCDILSNEYIFLYNE